MINGYFLSDETINVIIDGKSFVVTKEDMSYQPVKEAIFDGRMDDVEDLMNKPKMISVMSKGRVQVMDGVVLFDGEEVHNSLTSKMLRMISEGASKVSIEPWINFMNKLADNPSMKSREALFNFLDHFSTPLTPDGDFLAFKRVRNNFFDLHSGKFDNSPGQVVEMPREQCDDDSRNTCSKGLHACASRYLGWFCAGDSNCKVVIVKINPRDVVAVPHDYEFSKMRVCRYEVVAETDPVGMETIQSSEYYWDDGWDQEEEELWEEEGFEVGDRVRLVAPVTCYPIGATGIIQKEAVFYDWWVYMEDGTTIFVTENEIEKCY